MADKVTSIILLSSFHSDLAGFLHITQLHFLTTEVMRTISRHQRLIKPISVTELQRRLLKYETDLQQWYLSAPDDLRGPADDLEPCHRLMRYISEPKTYLSQYRVTLELTDCLQ